MRKVLWIVPLLLVLAMPLAAQEYSGCCTSSAMQSYPPSPIFGSANHGCRVDDTWVVDPCPAGEPTAVPTTAPQPTAVPPPWEPGKTVTLPSWISWVLNLFAPNLVIPFSALLIAVLMPVVQLLKQVLAMFKMKLSGKVIYIVTAFIALLTEILAAINDGVIQSAEWFVLLGSALAAFGAFFGYKFLFSVKAQAKLL